VWPKEIEMYMSVYGMRILGIFKHEIDAINYNYNVRDGDNRYPKHEELKVIPTKDIKEVEFLHDLSRINKKTYGIRMRAKSKG
jgi:hypothetical protein